MVTNTVDHIGHRKPSKPPHLDVLVAFNEEAYESHKGDVGETGVIIYNTGEFELESDGKSFGMPFDDLAKSTGNSRAANMVVIGALAYLVNMTQSIFEQFGCLAMDMAKIGSRSLVLSFRGA